MALNKTLIALAFALALTANTTASHQKSANPVDYVINSAPAQIDVTRNPFDVSGVAGRFTGVIRVNPSQLTSASELTSASVDVSIPATLPTTGADKLKNHLATDFLSSPANSITSLKNDQAITEQAKDGLPKPLIITGPLTINDVTQIVTFAVTINSVDVHPRKKTAAVGFDATATILRSDFGLSAYAPAVSDEVVLRITVEALAKVAD